MIVNAGPDFAGAQLVVFVGVDPGNLSVHGGGPYFGLTGGDLGAPSPTGSLLLVAQPLLTLDARGLGIIAEATMPSPIPEIEVVALLLPDPAASTLAAPVLRTYVLGYPGEGGHHP